MHRICFSFFFFFGFTTVLTIVCVCVFFLGGVSVGEGVLGKGQPKCIRKLIKRVLIM